MLVNQLIFTVWSHADLIWWYEKSLLYSYNVWTPAIMSLMSYVTQRSQCWLAIEAQIGHWNSDFLTPTNKRPTRNLHRSPRPTRTHLICLYIDFTCNSLTPVWTHLYSAFHLPQKSEFGAMSDMCMLYFICRRDRRWKLAYRYNLVQYISSLVLEISVFCTWSLTNKPYSVANK